MRCCLFSGLAVALAGWCAAVAAGEAAPVSRTSRGEFTAGGTVNVSELATQEATTRQGVVSRRSAQRGSRPGLGQSSSLQMESSIQASSVATELEEQPIPLTDPVFSAASAGPAPAPSASFLALPDNAVSFNPDTQGAVGPNHLMVTLSSQVRIQNRSGGVISTVSLEGFWGAIGNSNVFDPRVLYDAEHQRWVTVAIANPATNGAALLLAVSESSDPTGNWFRRQIRVDLEDGVFITSPNLGWTKDWLIVSAAMRDITGGFYYSSDVFVFNRTNVYANGSMPFTRVVYAPDGSSMTDLNVPVPAVSYDRSFPTNFLVANWDGSHAGGPGRLRLFSVSGPVNAPVFNDYAAQGGLFASAGAVWGSPSWLGTSPGNTNFAPQQGTSAKIFLGDARIQNVVFRNGLLWCAHHVFLPTNGATRSAVQWWSVSPGGVVLQHGRMDDASGARFYAFPSIAVNRYDDVLIGYSRFAANQFPSANYAFHSYQSVPGLLSTDTVLKAGEGRFTVADNGDILWGDWSGAVVDPLNDSDLWTIQEYGAAPVGGSDRWGTWWGRVSPPVTLSVRAVGAPTQVLAGSNVTYSVWVTNNSSHLASGVRLSSTLPPGAVFVSAAPSLGSCGHTNGVVLCNLGDVPGDINSNVVVSVSIVAQLVQGGSATNNLALLSFGPDQNPADNTTRVVTTVSAASDLAVTMGAAPSSVVVLSNNVTYTLTVTNQGPLPAGAVVLTNVLPAGLSFVSASSTVGSCTHASGRVTCTLGTLAVNAGARVTLVARAVASGFHTNRANAVSASIDPVPGNSSASLVVKASAAPTIQSIGNRTVTEDTVLGPLSLSIGDIETPAESLMLTGTSSNPSLVPPGNIVYGGSGAARLFSVTPATNAWGTAWVTNTVTDGDGLSTSTSFMLTINSVPDPPVITDIPNQNGNEDTVIGPIQFLVGDAESSAATLNLSGASTAPGLIPNANIVFGGSGSNRTVTLRPLTNQFGTATITITVSDGTSMTTDQFVATVNPINDLPTINDVSNRAINEDSPSGTTIGLSIGDMETPAASLVLSGTSSNQVLVPNGNITFSAGGTSRSVMIVPVANQFGTTLITLTVTDTDGGSTSDTFVLTVNPVNDPPTLATIPHMTINEDSGTTNVTLTGIGTGASNESQTNVVTATSSRPSLVPHPTVTYTSPNATGTLSFAPVADSNGVATITVTVNDGGLSNSVVTRTFNVTVNAINDAPFISALTNAVIDEDSSTGTIPFTVGDVDSPIASLTASARSSNTTLVPDVNIVLNGAGANRTVTVTPAGNQSGETLITVFVTDGTVTNTGTFLLTVRSMNDQPSITITTNEITVAEDQTASFNLTIGDAETSPAGLTLTALSSNPSLTPAITFDGSGSNRTVSVVPATNLSGTATITFSVFDTDGASNSVSLLLTILQVNDLPTLEVPADVVVMEDAPLQVVTLTGISSGAPNEVQTLAVTAASDNPSLIPHPVVIYTSPEAAGRLEFTPVSNANGEAVITVSVSDGQATNSRIFRVTVTAINDPPSIASISDRETSEDVTASVLLTIGDVETPSGQLTVRAVSSNPELLDETGISVSVTGTNRTLLLTPLADQSGQSTTITVFVSDGTNEMSVGFSLTVLPVNDLPTISGLANLAVARDSGPTNIVFTVDDPETLPSSLVVTAFSANQTLLPDANVVVTGNGASRTLTLTPAAGQSGAATVHVVARDGAGGTVTNSFTLTVGLMQVALLIERSGNSAVISWPGDSPGWTLQSTTNLNLTASWIPVAEVPVITNNRYRVTNSLSGASRFYRLSKP